MTIKRKMEKKIWYYTYNGILLTHKKDNLFPICTNMRILRLVKQIRQRKTDIVCYHLYVEPKK